MEEKYFFLDIVFLYIFKLCHKNSVNDGEGKCANSCGSTGLAETRSDKLRRLGRTLAASGAVPLTIQNTLIDRALKNLC
jgi:hypothetical protein